MCIFSTSLTHSSTNPSLLPCSLPPSLLTMRAHTLTVLALSPHLSPCVCGQATSDAMVARVDREGMRLVIIGTSAAVRSVRLLLDTQVPSEPSCYIAPI